MPPIVDHHHRHHSQIDTDKQPIKWMQLPIAKFNEVAVPHHVNQLKLLKMSIQKNLRAGDWAGAHRDQVNASVVVKQLQTLVNEMDILRNRVIDSDLPKFDKLINSSRQAAINILQEFIELSQQPPKENNPFYEDEEVANEESEYNSKQLQLSLETSRLAAECQQQERCAVAWENLQREIEQVHQLYEELGEIVHTQGEAVTEIETNVEVTTEEVTQGEKHLAKAADLNVAAYPLCGAIIGSCVGGPIGVVAGIKIGTLVALTGSILGFAGGRMLKDANTVKGTTELDKTT